MKARVNFREGSTIKEQAKGIDGWVIEVEELWVIDDGEPFAGETAWAIRDDRATFEAQMSWIPSGDLEFLRVKDLQVLSGKLPPHWELDTIIEADPINKTCYTPPDGYFFTRYCYEANLDTTSYKWMGLEWIEALVPERFNPNKNKAPREEGP